MILTEEFKKRGRKFIVVTGGVLSGLGKGIATASIGHLLSSRLNVVPIKCDGYLNTDPGTMNPIEHGEVFVLDDGGEVDMDFGHYERFLGVTCRFEWNITMGKVFKTILEQERKGKYLGQTVQFIPHVTETIKAKILEIAYEEDADIVLIEIGGTIGDIENELYVESVRQLRQEVGPGNSVFIHLTYIPVPAGIHEQKSKPTQQSVKLLNERGIRPDVIIGRSPHRLTDKIKAKISLFCNISPDDVISNEDVDSVYRIPLIFEEEGLTEILHKHLGIYSPPVLGKWRGLVENLVSGKEPLVRVAICGKYVDLHDSYASVIEALHHVSAHVDGQVEVAWLDTTDVEKGRAEVADVLEDVDAVIVPGGFGVRGIEGKIAVIRYCRENDVPFLGLCYGMQLAVIEFARSVCGLEKANTTEALEEGIQVDHPVVCILPEQREVKSKGGTMRLGGHDVVLKKDSCFSRIYNSEKIRERFRHRYEVTPEYVQKLSESGIVFSGTNPDGSIMQAMELPGHPCFVACQFHPELTSRIEKPAPLFMELVRAALKRKESA